VLKNPVGVLAILSGIERNWGMRGRPQQQVAIMMSTDTGVLIPLAHPIRKIRTLVDAVLAGLDADFAAMYAAGGRPSIPPEQWLKSAVLMALYSICSERAFCERLNYDMLFSGSWICRSTPEPSTRRRSRRTGSG
jgi:transposase